MNTLVWKLLRQHISIGQLAGFFLANLFGMMIVLLSVQFYKDVIPVFTEGDSFMKKDFIIATKKISTLGSFAGKSNTFSPEDIADLKKQSFTKTIGAFTPSQFKVSAGLGMQKAGIHLSTDMFFESVPDEFVDIKLDKWHFDEETHTIPIIIPRNYLNLYNFGFAQSRSLPKLSEGLMGLIQMDIMMRGNGRVEQYKGNIVGFSNRLNTILVPQSFMNWANPRRGGTTCPTDHRGQQSRRLFYCQLLSEKRLRDGRRKTGCRKDHLFPSPYRRYCAGSRFIHQYPVILYPDAQHILTAPKEYNQARKSASDRLQPQQGSAALSDTDRRTEHHRTDFICRIGMLAAQLLHREYQTPLPATGNRFVMGSCQYGYSFIPHRISH